MPEVLTPEIVPAEQEAKVALESATQVMTRAKAVVVKSDDDYRAADSACATIKAEMKRLESQRDSFVRPLNDTVKRINAGFKDATNALQQALDAYRKPMTAFQAELARQREDAEREARKERERLEAEARANADAEIAAAKKAREEADAARAAAEGDDPFAAVLAEQEAEEAEVRANEQAEAARAAIREIATIDVPVMAAPKVTGAASKTHTIWTYEITDEALVPMAYRPIDHASLARDVKAGKDECRIPGVRVFSRIEVK